MKLDYTKQELALQLASLAQVLGTAQVVDPYRGALLDPATLEPCGESDPVPTLDEDGRGMQLVQAETGDEMRLYQSIRVEDKPCVLVVHCALPRYRGASAGAKNSYDRALAQYCADMRHDYVTGVYNARFLEEEYRAYAEKQAMHGQPVGAVLLRVNEYWQLCNEESTEAAECCLNTAAGILQLAVGTDQKHAVLARLEEGTFVAITVGMPAARLAQSINEALEASRRAFSITLARRGTFTVSVASAEWGETSSWEMMLALAQQRL